MSALTALRRRWNDFFYAPMPLRTCALLRIGFGVLIFVDFLVLYRHVDMWFGPDGLLTFAASRAIVDPDTITLFQLFPDSHLAVHVLYALLLVQAVCLTIGYFGRVQAASLFVLVTSFQHRNIAMFDAEDHLLRLACFFLIFMPVDERWSVRSLVHGGRPNPGRTYPIWPLRLLQIEMSLIYLSAGLLKLAGEDWRSGVAIYYATQVDLFRRFPLPGFLVHDLALSRLATWAVAALELTLGPALWWGRTRTLAIAAAVTLHLAIEYSLNLFLFEWAMIVGVLSFRERA